MEIHGERTDSITAGSFCQSVAALKIRTGTHQHMRTHLGGFYQLCVPTSSTQKPIFKSHYTVPPPRCCPPPPPPLSEQTHKPKHLPQKPISEKDPNFFFNGSLQTLSSPNVAASNGLGARGGATAQQHDCRDE